MDLQKISNFFPPGWLDWRNLFGDQCQKIAGLGVLVVRTHVFSLAVWFQMERFKAC
jgi:hypothetical protein